MTIYIIVIGNILKIILQNHYNVKALNGNLFKFLKIQNAQI